MSSSAFSTNAPQPERPCFFNLRLALPPSSSRLTSVPQYTPQIHPDTITHMHHSRWAWCRGGHHLLQFSEHWTHGLGKPWLNRFNLWSFVSVNPNYLTKALCELCLVRYDWRKQCLSRTLTFVRVKAWASWLRRGSPVGLRPFG